MVRQFQNQDTESIIDLLRLNTPKYFGAAEEEDFKRYLTNEIEDYFVFEVDGHLLGCGGINYLRSDREARISWDIVHPDHQGKGIGSVLLKHRLSVIKGRTDIDIITVRTSQLADKYYQRFDFTLVEIVKDYWDKGFDLYKMQRPV